MAFPDRIERTLLLPHTRAAVWAALTTAEGLAGWFGEQASVDLRPGGSVRLGWSSGDVVELRVERVQEPHAVVFTWDVDGGPASTRVEFTLEAVDGGTRLHLVESGFAPLPDDVRRVRHDSHTEGWGRELGELVAYLDAS